MMKNILAFAISLLLLASLAHPQSDGFAGFEKQAGESFKKSFEGDWQTLALAAIATGILFNILIYMAGMALEAENLKRYARAEGLQVTASALMIFFAVSLLYTISNSGLAFFGEVLGGDKSAIRCAAVPDGNYYIWTDYGFGTGPLGAFKCKLQEKITALDKAYDNIRNINLAPEMRLSICYMLFGAPVWCNSWDTSLHQAVEERHLLASKIVGLLMPLHAQYTLAEYLQKNMLSVFLPAGLVMRIFPFSRGLGGLFIAIALGFFFVWPAFFVLTDSSFVKVSDQSVPSTAAGICYTGFKGTAIVQSMATTTANSAEALSNLSMTELLYQVTIGAMFYPFVALVLTLMFVRAFTPLLGGDLGELMRMVARLG